MDKRFVRIENISIENFKNVQKGTLDFENRRKNYRASIVGLYGQNGSGKTALIDALQLLKFSLSGKAIPEKYADYIINSFLPYELGVIKSYVLNKITYDIDNEKERTLLEKLRREFKNIIDIPSHFVPSDSVFREFIGKK